MENKLKIVVFALSLVLISILILGTIFFTDSYKTQTKKQDSQVKSNGVSYNNYISYKPDSSMMQTPWDVKATTSCD
ncbi:MAG: hypothetical protein NUV46_01705 [Nanoarchaeota archaeon]|nr:hypothetical protein [Nanoarchaeota archaeon]